MLYIRKKSSFYNSFSALERNRHWWCKNCIFRRGKSCCYCYRCLHCCWLNYLQAVWFIFHVIVCTCNIHHVSFLKEFLYHSVIFGIRIAFPLQCMYILNFEIYKCITETCFLFLINRSQQPNSTCFSNLCSNHIWSTFRTF